VPTALFGTAPVLLSAMSAADAEGRPVWAPTSGNTTAGTSNGPLESYSGYDILGNSVWFDNNIPETACDLMVPIFAGTTQRSG